jgi:hypothetical protein
MWISALSLSNFFLEGKKQHVRIIWGFGTTQSSIQILSTPSLLCDSNLWFFLPERIQEIQSWIFLLTGTLTCFNFSTQVLLLWPLTPSWPKEYLSPTRYFFLRILTGFHVSHCYIQIPSFTVITLIRVFISFSLKKISQISVL